MFEFKGKIEKIFDEASFGTSNFKKREFVVLGGNDGKQYVTFTATQNKCDMLNEVKEGDQVTVQFLPKGRRWPKTETDIRYFNSLEVVHIMTPIKPKDSSSIFDEDEHVDKPTDDWLSEIE